MSTFGLVINQEYEPSHSLLAKDQEHSFILPVDQQPEQSSLLESFALVIEQSLMTQDRPLLKSILLNDN